MNRSAGRHLGHYEILAPLGAGGMGEVYRAKDPRLGREVIKVLPETLAQNTEALRRFEREAKALAALSHPSIVSIFDIGTHDETAYVVMELLQGKTLRTTLTSALLWQKALPIAVEIAVPYMSPEQLRGKTVDTRSDIVAFGCVLYEMITGKRAFCGNTAAETFAAILTKDVPSAAETKEIPVELGLIIQHCLEKHPEQRFHSAHDLAYDLKTISAGTSKSVPTEKVKVREALCTTRPVSDFRRLCLGLHRSSFRSG